MKKAILVILAVAVLLSLAGCCDHQWTEATFTSPKTCTVCGATRGKPLQPPESFNTNDILYTGSFQLEFVSVSAISELRPPNASGDYIYFSSPSTETWYDIIFKVSNVSAASFLCGDKFSVAAIVGNDEYECYCILESEDGTALSYGTVQSVDALQTVTAHFIAELSLNCSITSSDIELEVASNRIPCTGAAGEEARRLLVGD